MNDFIKPKRALLSVSDKTGLIQLAQKLSSWNIVLLSTGGTARILREAGLDVTDVSDVTGFPEIMNGRVKTLHPNIHGGLLARRDLDAHKEAMQSHKIDPIDLLIVNLYPFEATVASGANIEECIENIDIGGPAMIRASAKNYDFVTTVTSSSQYDTLIEAMNAHQGAIGLDLRKEFARDAFTHTGTYDAAISNWMSQSLTQKPTRSRVFAVYKKADLRYGENPHQKAALFTTNDTATSVANAIQHQGKPLSYNNINDSDSAFALISEFDPHEVAACAIIKHANPCGVAKAQSLKEAYIEAFNCDQTSAFGGIVAFNQMLDEETAKAVTEIFTEVVIAPKISHGARKIFETKPNLRLLETGGLCEPHRKHDHIKQVAGGFLIQDADTHALDLKNLEVVTKRKPNESELNDMLFAWTVAKHVKSNAIVYAKNGATVGIGAGQMSRIDSTRIATLKAKDMAETLALDAPKTQGSVVASDAFFPFADGLLAAAKAGARAIIQPGGAMRDDDVIEAADANDLAMIFTKMRHFRH